MMRDEGILGSPEPSRRELLRTVSCGFGWLAFAGMCTEARSADPSPRDPLAPRPGHLPARAKRVIFLFMQGGPSQVDTFDPKPRLSRDHGERAPFHVARTRKVTAERVLGSPWKFARHGQCGLDVSEILPEIAKQADKLCVLRGMHTEGVAHGPATLFLHTGATNLVRPSIGSWISYGLGTENESMPAFVTISPSQRMGGPRNWSNAFLPAVHQGTAIGRVGVSAKKAAIANLENDRLSHAERRERFALLEEINRAQLRAAGGESDLESVLRSYELAWRMQTEAPEILDLSNESKATQALYGIGDPHTDEFGRQCLQARKLAEAGVRFIQVSYADNSNNPRWDQHSNLPAHAKHARATDKPVAGLLLDLEARGLLDDTLVWWGGEFGRTPFAEGNDGRDHNPKGFTLWLAGGGVRPGFTYGATDEFGYEAVEGRVHMHDLHATILHLLGIDHERLTYRYAGRDFRLTDVHGRVVREILA